MAFRKKRATSRGLLPAGTVDFLEAWGRHNFSPPSDELPDLSLATFISSFTLSSEVQEHPAAVAGELRDIALAMGGWHACGACDVIHAFLPSEVATAAYREVEDARIRFLRSRFGVDELRMRLTIKDKSRYAQLFPGEL
jgi:hypothetical protein